MAIEFAFNHNNPTHNIIKVIGVGGGGGNAVNTMFQHGISGVDFMICNTDQQALNNSSVPNKVRLGSRALGAGANPEVGRESALESLEQLRESLRQGTKMVFITAGMGGGTGTGAAPVIASLAREMGILTVGIVTLPFGFEGARRMKNAEQGIHELEQCVDALIVINNSKLMDIAPKRMRAIDAFMMVDSVLLNAARGLADMINEDGYINVDFEDAKAVLQNSGTALIGLGTADGENRAIVAIEGALSSPLLENMDINGASGVLINISASMETLTMEEFDEINKYVTSLTGKEGNIIVGAAFNDELGDKLQVTVIATGFDRSRPGSKPEPRVVQDVRRPTFPTPRSAALQATPPAPPKMEQTGLFDASAQNAQQVVPPTPKPDAEAMRPAAPKAPTTGRIPVNNIDYHRPETQARLESEPSYLRMGLTIDDEPAKKKAN